MRIDLLSPHPLNAKLYGSIEDSALTDSVKRLGVLEPVVYSRMSVDGRDAENCILSGTRRWNAAKKANLTEVPTREIYLCGLEAERFLIEANRQREKSKVQRLQEFKRLKEIEEKLAKDRQVNSPSGKGTRLVGAKLREPIKGRSIDKAAAIVGLKPRTAEKGLVVLNLAETGDVRAQQAIESIDRNEMSVDRAYREMRSPKRVATDEREVIALAALEQADELLGKISGAISRYLKNREAIQDKKDESVVVGRIRGKIENLLLQTMEGVNGNANPRKRHK